MFPEGVKEFHDWTHKETHMSSAAGTICALARGTLDDKEPPRLDISQFLMSYCGHWFQY